VAWCGPRCLFPLRWLLAVEKGWISWGKLVSLGVSPFGIHRVFNLPKARGPNGAPKRGFWGRFFPAEQSGFIFRWDFPLPWLICFLFGTSPMDLQRSHGFGDAHAPGGGVTGGGGGERGRGRGANGGRGGGTKVAGFRGWSAKPGGQWARGGHRGRRFSLAFHGLFAFLWPPRTEGGPGYQETIHKQGNSGIGGLAGGAGNSSFRNANNRCGDFVRFASPGADNLDCLNGGRWNWGGCPRPWGGAPARCRTGGKRRAKPAAGGERIALDG